MTKRLKGQRIMGAGYAKALRVIVDGGATWREVGAAVGVERITAQTLCRGFHRQQLTHISAWKVGEGDARNRAPIYAFGPGEDVPWPAGDRPVMNKRTPPELLAFCALVKELMLDAYHGKGMADTIGGTPRTVRNHIRELHKLKLAYIAGYDDRSVAGTGYPLFAWGPGKSDKPKPKPIPKRELWNHHNAVRSARRKQSKVLHGLVTGRSLDGRSNRSLNRLPVQPHHEGVSA